TCQGSGLVDSQMNPYVPTDNPGGLSDQVLKAGDVPGHDFHGNQYTGGQGGGDSAHALSGGRVPGAAVKDAMAHLDTGAPKSDAEHQAHVMGMTADQTRQHLRDEHGRAGSGSASKASLQAAHLLAHGQADKGQTEVQKTMARYSSLYSTALDKVSGEQKDWTP